MFTTSDQCNKVERDYSAVNSVSVFQTNPKAKPLEQLAPKYFARQNGRRAKIKARETGPAPWPAPVSLPAPTCFGVGRLADASEFTKWPTRMSVPVGLLIIKIALMDINLMLVDIYLHNFTPQVCFYESMKLGILLFFQSYISDITQTLYLLTVIRHCAVELY